VESAMFFAEKEMCSRQMAEKNKEMWTS